MIHAVAVLAFMVATTTSQPPPPAPAKVGQTKQEQTSSAQGQTKTDDQSTKKPVPAVPQSTPEIAVRYEQHFSDESKKAATRIDWPAWAVAAFTLGLLVVAVLQGCVMHGQRKLMDVQAGLMRGQLGEMKTSGALMLRQLAIYERPWVTASITPRGPLCFDESGGAYVMLLLTLKNFGHSVATHVRFDYGLLANSHTVIAKQQEIAERIKPDTPGEVVFPHDRNREPIYCRVSKEEIERYAINDGDAQYVTLSIVGVVAYRFATSSDPHFTKFAYRVGRIDSKNVLRPVKVGAELQPEEIHTSLREPGGSHAD